MTKDKTTEFLRESNAIEREYSDEALNDAENAWFYGSNAKLRMRAILNIHGFLMERLNPEIAGKLRICDVCVGETMCASHKDVELLLYRWIDKHGEADTARKIRKAHVEFEKIHPFEDGNGRTGRIIMNMQRLNAGIPLLVIHEGEEQVGYYKWFK